MDDGGVHLLAKILPSLINNLWWNIVIDDWTLDEKTLCKWQSLQHCKYIIPEKFYNDRQIMLAWHLVAGDTTPQFTINIEQDN